MAFDKSLLAGLSESEEKSVKRLLERGVSLPPQPQVLQELYAKLMAGVADVRYARILAQDPGLVAMLFKVVQSASYRRYQPFESVEHFPAGDRAAAGGQPGARHRTVLGHAGQAQPQGLRVFWVRSRAISELAMLVAEDRVTVATSSPIRPVSPACSTTAAGGPDAALLDLLQGHAPGRAGALGRSGRGGSSANADHCVVGYLMARHWKLPDSRCDPLPPRPLPSGKPYGADDGRHSATRDSSPSPESPSAQPGRGRGRGGCAG